MFIRKLLYCLERIVVLRGVLLELLCLFVFIFVYVEVVYRLRDRLKVMRMVLKLG